MPFTSLGFFPKSKYFVVASKCGENSDPSLVQYTVYGRIFYLGPILRVHY